MKRSVLMILAASMVGLSAAACGGNDEADEVPPVEENVNTQPAPAPAPMTTDTMMMGADTMMQDTMMPDTGSM